MPVTLSELDRNGSGIVEAVDDATPGDPVARRLREIGFVPGEAISVVAQAPVGADPILVQIGFTRFALRRSEAARVRLRPGAARA